jgi:biopolymer transport protein ExbD
MAEIQTPASGNKRRKLSTPRIDLTPMVDLGFLLITFFMYTTTMARPRVMDLHMPYNPRKEVKPPVIPAESTIVLLPTGADSIAFYPGTQQASAGIKWCNYSSNNSLRSLIQKEISRVAHLPNTFSNAAHKLHVLIKPDTSAPYDAVVHCLDEMAISEVPYYTIMRITAEEQTAIRKFLPTAYGK